MYGLWIIQGKLRGYSSLRKERTTVFKKSDCRLRTVDILRSLERIPGMVDIFLQLLDPEQSFSVYRQIDRKKQKNKYLFG